MPLPARRPRPPEDETGVSRRVPTVDRRAFLVGAAAVAGTVVTASCSSSSVATGATARTAATAGLTLAPTFDTGPTFAVAGVPQRFPFQLATPDGAPALKGPAMLDMQVLRDNRPVGPPITVPRHQDGIPNAYYPLVFTPDAAGTYTARASVDGRPVEQSFQVGTTAGNQLVQVGQPMRPVDTPTPEDHRGVEPICTHQPTACPLHAETLTATMAGARPLALLISTPRFCQIGICGPVLELLLEEHAARPGMAMVHAEVYRDAAAKGNIAGATLAPVVDAYGLTYEPSLLVAKADGTVVARLDYVFDRTELRQALDQAG